VLALPTLVLGLLAAMVAYGRRPDLAATRSRSAATLLPAG
jgi:hypothetical protein